MVHSTRKLLDPRALLVLALAAGCKESTGTVIAKRVSSRADLIGGPGALGEVGDFLLANDKIRVIVQGGGYSRGFGVYGGALIDADLQRPGAAGDSGGGNGHDNFSELFPGLFLRAMRPLDNGFKLKENEDGSKTIVVTGKPAEFLFMVETINNFIVGDDDLLFQNEYTLRPGKRYVEITTRIINQGQTRVRFPGDLSGLTMADFKLPVGDVILFGAGNKVFSPIAGFDIRYTLERLYKTPPALPALPGLVTPFIATKGEHVSYGFASAVSDEALSFTKRAGYADARTDDLLIPFIFSGFTGAFYGAAPDVLGPNQEFAIKKYFIVGSGDVASIRDVVMEIRGETSGAFAGTVRNAQTMAVERGAELVTFDEKGQPYSQHTADENGQFRGSYQPGKYSYVVTADGRFPSKRIPFEVKAGATTSVDVELPAPGLVSINIHDEDGRGLPAKCSLVAVHPVVAPNLEAKDFLYDLVLGERRRPTDFVPNGADPKTREYLEEVIFGANGQGMEQIRPGKYRAVCSRGPEYDLLEREIEVVAGRLSTVSGPLKRVVNTAGWASGDYHLHQENSVDSELPLSQRVIECAAEGVDLALSSDHNFVTDLGPAVTAAGLDGWLQSMVGLELTTLEIGHFNGFPLRYDPGPITKGSFAWSGRTPTELLTDLRALGRYGPDQMVVQVNHPRDTILGYFNDYNFNPDRGRVEANTSVLLAPKGPEFGPDKYDPNFDAIEIFNGKRFELIRSYRVPEVLPPPPLPMGAIPPAGSILRDDAGKVAFPGGLEDWFVLLNQGHRYTATGNSDSHESEEECGSPRTYVPVSNDRPGEIPELEIVHAMKSQRAVATNGPFILVDVDGKTLGQTADGTKGSVTAKVAIRTAPWVRFDTVNFIRNGRIVRTKTGDRESLAELTETFTSTVDSWLVVEVIGNKASSHWPVVVPHEIPSLQISDAVGGIAGAFGINLNSFGNLRPPLQSVVYTYAFTNPVYIDADGDGAFKAIGITRQALEAADVAPRVNAHHPHPYELPALVRMFSAFSHGH